MKASLPITLLIESSIAVVYGILTHRPPAHLLLSSLLGNFLTQSLLWMALLVLFEHYLIVLVVAEFLIWLIEGAVLYYYPWNHFSWREALGLSLVMNLASFGIGWFLPI